VTTGGGGAFVILAGGAAVEPFGRSTETISSFEPAGEGSVGGR